MDFIIRNARLAGAPELRVDIGIANGRIAAIEPGLAACAEQLDVGGKLVAPGLVETHLHLDKACILDRCRADSGSVDEAISEVARAKASFTPEDVYQRARRTLEQCIAHGSTHVRTHLEVDPGIGLRGLEGVLPLVEEYRWAVDLEICIFPQEGLLNNPGTEALMLEAMKRGGKVLGACPYTDSDPHAQIDRIFELARELDVDIDMHLDFDLVADDVNLIHLCRRTQEFGHGGRVTAGHVTRLSALEPTAFAHAARQLADSGVALTILPSTDLYLMGRQREHDVVRGVTPAHRLLPHGVNCSLATNNVLNPFTPFGDCSLVRMANLYANTCHVGARGDMAQCFQMITTRAARLMNLADYGLAVGKPADFVVLDCNSVEAAVAELAQVLYAFKAGRRTLTREPARLHRPVRGE